jgi:hypothetical protein
MPALSNKPVEVRFKENDFACFGTQRYKYQYGMLLHDIPKAPENTMGSFILPPEDDYQATVDAHEFGETVELTRETCPKSFRVETYHIKTILAATRKLTLGRSDSDYKTNFTLMRKLHLTQLRKDIPADVLKEAITDSVTRYLHAEGELKGKGGSPTGVPRGKAKSTKKGKQIKMRWILNKTKVATTAGDNERFADLAATTSGWVDGILVAIDETLGVERPYKIQWYSSPQVYSFVSESEMVALYDTWLECEDKVLCIQWLTGREMLWLYERKGVEEPQLRYGTVMYYDRLLDKYKVLFRDGSEAFVTAREFDSANDNNKDYTDEERSIANQQHWTDRAAKKIASYGRYCARNIIPQEEVTKPPLSSVPTSGAISTKTKSRRKGEEGPTAPAGDVGSLSTSTIVASGFKSRPLTNPFLARYTDNDDSPEDEDFFASVTKLGTTGATTNADLVVQGDKGRDQATIPSAAVVQAGVSTITTMESTTYLVM